MSLITHPLIARVVQAGEAFRAGDSSAEHLQEEVSAAMSALEGDVPRLVHDAMFQLEAQIDSARFTIPEGERAVHITRSLDAFKACLAKSAGAAQSGS